ncbi:MAG TPA: hypothetical protein VGW38_25700, partial [Chloroflexota bacterium]|nr:hypothetical protein [Chloroflexota bacterium]
MSQFTTGQFNPRPRLYPYSHYVQQAVNQYRQASSASGTSYAAQGSQGAVVGADRGGAELAQAYDALWLRPGAPLPVVKAVYRALASHHHPDVGGDNGAMIRLNRAYETIIR